MLEGRGMAQHKEGRKKGSTNSEEQRVKVAEKGKERWQGGARGHAGPARQDNAAIVQLYPRRSPLRHS